MRKARINPDMFGAPTPWFEWILWGFETKRYFDGFDHAFCSWCWQNKWAKKYLPWLGEWGAERSARKNVMNCPRGEDAGMSDDVKLEFNEETGEMRWRGELIDPNSGAYEVMKNIIQNLKFREAFIPVADYASKVHVLLN